MLIFILFIDELSEKKALWHRLTAYICTDQKKRRECNYESVPDEINGFLLLVH